MRVTSNRNIKAKKYKPYGYNEPKVYYIRITDNSGYCSGLLYNTLKLICKKFNAKYIGVKSKGHGVKSFNKPHIHAVLLTSKSISLTEFLKLIPKGFNAKLWRVRTFSDFISVKRYITEHIKKPEKRGFLLVILAGKILKLSLEINPSLIASLDQAPSVMEGEKLREVIFWRR